MESATPEEIALLKQMHRDWNWMSQHNEELLNKFENEFIAIKDEKVVAASASHDELLRQIKNLGLDARLMIVKFFTRKPQIF